MSAINQLILTLVLLPSLIGVVFYGLKLRKSRRKVYKNISRKSYFNSILSSAAAFIILVIFTMTIYYSINFLGQFLLAVDSNETAKSAISGLSVNLTNNEVNTGSQIILCAIISVQAYFVYRFLMDITITIKKGKNLGNPISFKEFNVKKLIDANK